MPRDLEAWEQTVVENRERRLDDHWTDAALAYEGRATLGLTPDQMAGAFGVSAAQVRRLLRVWAVFADPATRIPTLAWGHYVRAVATDDPLEWVQKAADAQWSLRDLDEAIRAARARDSREVQQTALEGTFRRFQRAWEDADPDQRSAFFRDKLTPAWPEWRTQAREGEAHR